MCGHIIILHRISQGPTVLLHINQRSAKYISPRFQQFITGSINKYYVCYIQHIGLQIDILYRSKLKKRGEKKKKSHMK